MSDSPEYFRRKLAPAPSSSSDLTGDKLRLANVSLKKPHRQVVAVACTACQQKKAKVDVDGRRRVARKRKQDESDHYRQLALSILETIRNSKDDQVRELISCIRSNASLDEIIAFLDQNAERMKQDGTDKSRAASEELNELRAEARTLQHLNTEARTRKRVLGIHELTSRAPLVQLSAKPWTNITDNDEFVSEVVSLYLTWWHPIWRPFETKYFVEACRAGDLKSPFCSPFLFHAVVSIGSLSCDSTWASDDPDNKSVKGGRFHTEARRIWLEEEMGKPSLLNLQALYLLSMDTSMRGNDGLGWSLLGQMAHMYRDLRLGEERKTSESSTTLSAQLRRATRSTSWTVFNYCSLYSLNFLKLPPLEPPSIGLPYDEHETAEVEQWSPYPHHGQVGFHWNLMYNKLCELSVICWKLGKLLFSPRDDDDMNNRRMATESVGEELISWRAQLPFELRRHPDMAPPVMEIYAISYYASITLMEFLKKPEVTPPSTPTNIEFVSKQDTQTMECIMEISTLIEIFSNAYDTSRPAPSLFQGASMGAFTLIKSLDIPEHVPLFARFCDFVIAGSKHYVLWRGIAGMIRLTAEKVGVTLPPGLDQELLDVTKGVWHSGDRKSLNNSQYPSYTLAKDTMDDDDFTLGELLDKWDALELGPNK